MPTAGGDLMTMFLSWMYWAAVVTRTGLFKDQPNCRPGSSQLRGIRQGAGRVKFPIHCDGNVASNSKETANEDHNDAFR
jgi:hypothetical protein